MVAMCQLYHAVQDLINQEEVTIISPKISYEYKNIFDDIQYGIIEIWVLCAGMFIIYIL